MGISSSLNAGVMGLAVNSSKLSAIADNIANSGTNGYKRSAVDFASIVVGEQQGSYDAGGVRSTVSREVTTRGSLITSNNSTDIAIGGQGMLPVTTVTARDLPVDTRPLLMTSTGSFTPDDEGYLRTASGLQLLGWPVDSSGSVGGVIRASGASLEPVRVTGFDFASNATTEMDLGLNLPISATEFGATPTPYSTGVEYFDAVGASQQLTFTFTPTPAATAPTSPSNAWRMEIVDGATGTTVGDFNLTFANTGAGAGFLASVTPTTGTWTPATGNIRVTADHGPIDIEIGQLGQAGKLTQFASAFAPVGLTKNGTPVGGLNRVEVTEFGFLEAVYDTGFRQTIYQIPVAATPNPNGLTPVDNQAFQVSSSSGAIYLWNAGEGPVGQMIGYAIEQSSTDIAQELTQLIETQRAYSSNAKIVQTVDEMLQETTNLKR